MLSTDAHNSNQFNKMSCQEFIKNTKIPCPSIPIQYLEKIYQRITAKKFQTQISNIEIIYDRLMGLSQEERKTFHNINLTNQLMKGHTMLKICQRSHKFVQRFIKLTKDQQCIQWVNSPQQHFQTARFIKIEDIIEINLGRNSQAMIQANVPSSFDSICFTIRTYKRTLDLKARCYEDRAKWIDYIRTALIKQRNKLEQKLQEQEEDHEKIQNIWNTEIFPKWDSYWDYNENKPKKKSYIIQGIEFLCCCYWRNNKSYYQIIKRNNINNNYTVLEILWNKGLIKNSRKTLWPLVIGNKLCLNYNLIDSLKSRKIQVENLNQYRNEKYQIIQSIQLLITIHSEISSVMELLSICSFFFSAMKGIQSYQIEIYFLNFMHLNHLLIFYSGNKEQIGLRCKFMDYLLNKNIPAISQHFKLLKLESKYYLISWFLSIFTNCFKEQLVLRIWDNYLLNGEIYLFRIGLSILKYYEIQLKMCTFDQGLKILRKPSNTSAVLLFKILQQNIEITIQQYHQYIQIHNQKIIKIQIQSIPLKE